MPANNVKPTSSRRPPRKPYEDEDVDLKRLRGEISCAECRRLKLKCDKKVPCNSCVRRGCHSVCPSGTLTAGQGTRFILADTEHLHRKIADMSNRIRQLEDALAILQATVSSSPHPLLQDELLKIKFGSESLNSAESPDSSNSNPNDSLDALGTLTLGDQGEMKYFGGSAGSETLLVAGEELDSENEGEDEITLSLPQIDAFANIFPFTTKKKANEETVKTIMAFLPTEQRARSLCQIYVDHGSFFFRPLRNFEIFDKLLVNVYKPVGDNQNDKASDAHQLAMLFFVLAMGALLDLDLPAYNAEAEHYYDLGRAALSSRSIFDSPQLDTVGAVGLMAIYNSLAGKNYTRDSAWFLSSLAAKLAQSIGLHRDSARWNLDAPTVQRRRNLFWEVFSADMSHSLAIGRPPAIHLSYVDCEFPQDEEETMDELGVPQCGFWRLKHLFAKDIFMALAETTLAAKAPSYATILELDKKIRQMVFPASFRPYVKPEESDFHSPSLSIRGFYASQYRTITMIYLHRSFFSQAMLDHPNNPLRSPFAPSFLTAYRCASVIIKASVHQFDRCSELATRLWFLLYHTFSAAVIMGSVVTHSPSSGMAPNALTELGLAVEIFQKGCASSRRARIAFHVLRKMHDKAVKAYTEFCSGNVNPSITFTSPLNFTSSDEDDDELAIFGGQTKVLVRNLLSRRGSADLSSRGSQIQTSSTLSSNVAAPPSQYSPNSLGEIHSSLVEYLSDSLGSSSPSRQAPRNSGALANRPSFDTAITLHGNLAPRSSASPPTSGDPLPREDYSPFSWFDQSHALAAINDQSVLSPNQSAGAVDSATYSMFSTPNSANSPSQHSSPSNDVDYALQYPDLSYQFFAGNAVMPDVFDLGLTSESGMDMQWMAFLQGSGILENANTDVTGLDGPIQHDDVGI